MLTRLEIVGNIAGESVKQCIYQALYDLHHNCDMGWLDPVPTKFHKNMECWFTEEGLENFLEANGVGNIQEYIQSTEVVDGCRVKVRERKHKKQKVLYEDEYQVAFRKRKSTVSND
jgi:hypothetical protein